MKGAKQARCPYFSKRSRQKPRPPPRKNKKKVDAGGCGVSVYWAARHNAWYYIDDKTGETSWTPPAGGGRRLARAFALAKSCPPRLPRCARMRECTCLVPCHTVQGGAVYWFNTRTNEVSLETPAGI